MNPKQMLTNGVFCPMPWTGLMYNFDGKVKNCIRSAGRIGDLKVNDISEILHGPVNLDTQRRMLQDQPGSDCHTCYDLEHNKKSFDIISDRIFYIRELKHTPLNTYELGNHDLRTVDVRWTNLCNFACVYCSPEFSSRLAQEQGKHIPELDDEKAQAFKQYVFSHAKQLRHVYLAGGEPLLMKQNLELLEILQKENPLVHVRVNTNLSKTDTRVFDKICEFENVHWTVSVESREHEFEYIRYGGSWQDFSSNLDTIKKLGHKISFNMLWFLLNYDSVFDCVDYFQKMGFHNNSFIIGALLDPEYLNIRHLPQTVLKYLEQKLIDRIAQRPGYLLEDSYRNMLHYMKQPFEKKLADSFSQLSKMDQRRDQDSSRVFKDLYLLREGN